MIWILFVLSAALNAAFLVELTIAQRDFHRMRVNCLFWEGRARMFAGVLGRHQLALVAPYPEVE